MWDINRGGNMCSCMGDTGKIFFFFFEEKLVVMRERGVRGIQGSRGGQ